MADLLDTKIKIFGVADDSIVDGPGLRYCIYTQGCSHHCAGCHNPGSWDFDAGVEKTIKEVIGDIEKNKLIRDVTLSGGDPFDQPHAVSILASELKKRGFGLWAYSGYTYEELLKKSEEDKDIKTILDVIDVLVDGPFIKSQKSLLLTWRGSSNQRIIDMNKTRETGLICLYSTRVESSEIPPNW